MKKYSHTLLPLVLMLFLFSSCDEDDIGGILNDSENASSKETADALKEALQVGTDTAVAVLSAQDGYYKDLAVKLLLPEELQNSRESFRSQSFSIFGFGTITGADLYDNGSVHLNINSMAEREEALILGLNRAAEEAANTAAPIFVDAISNMTINDANEILFGTDTAATFYLKSNTSTQLFNNYEPEIEEALNSVRIDGKSVVTLYEEYVNSYNSILNTSFMVDFMGNTSTIGAELGMNSVETTDISAYATNRALDGLFLKVGEEEENIRKDPLARVTDLLERYLADWMSNGLFRVIR